MAGRKAGQAPESPATTSTQELEQGATAVEETTTVTDVAVYTPGGAITTLDDFAGLMEEDANQDLGFRQEDIAVPIFRTLQANSPQVKRQNAKYIEGAEGGDFINTALGTVYKGMDGIHIVPVVFKRQATLWTPRAADGTSGAGGGGGFQGEIPIEDAEALLKNGGTAKNDKGKDVTKAPYKDKPAGLELVVAAMYFSLLVDLENGQATPIAFPLTSTQMKKARAWNAVMSQSRLPNREGPGSYTPKLFGFMYKVVTVPESNGKGDWMGVKIVQGPALLKFTDILGEDQKPTGKRKVTEGFPGAASIYQAARDLEKLYGEGRIKAKPDDESDFEVIPTGGADTPVSAEDDAKLPF